MHALSARTDRVFAWLSTNRARLHRVSLAAALTVFVVGLILSLRASPDILTRASHVALLGLVLVTLPLGLTLNALDFQIIVSGVSTRGTDRAS